ncbi:hypothetical protein O6H91_Y513100 [Diphasiastrum complanatum]|nr:hypothetical protein O6H91_Y513100 [Diphasiastrum complanatum]KAJ7195012.1 hypothetical protein O6H91_Y513100 [Diphasiastrum complanatum]KAJ7195013.1 hypothetical protein O6H91_Y513100 [Diphasiastrum complanatum]
MERSEADLSSDDATHERRTGISLFIQQFRALLRKNMLLSLRNKRATALQLASSFFFIFLIFAVDQAIKARQRTDTTYKNTFNPQPTIVPSIPTCETGYYIKSPCYDFLWSGNSSARISSIVTNIMNRNPGRPIPSAKVLGFATTDDVDRWLSGNPMRCTGAIHLQERGPSVIAYGLQTNSTSKSKRGVYEDPNFAFQIPLQAAVEREITRFIAGDSNLPWSVAFTEYAHPAISTVSTVGKIGPTFLLAAAMFGFVIQISNIVIEKELKLRQAMSTMGLYDSVYWLTWLTWEVLVALISSLLLVLFGMIFQFYFFLHNNFGVLFFMFFLFQFNMVGFAFLLSTFVNKSSSATTIGFFIFIIGFVTQLVTTFGFPYSKSFSKIYRIIWSFFPPNLFAIGLNYLGDATATKQDKGISWSGRTKCSNADQDCVLTMAGIFHWFVATFVLWLLLAIYLDNVLPDINGVRKPWLYFLKASYWSGKSTNYSEGGNPCCLSSLPQISSGNVAGDDDVAAEEESVKQQQANHIGNPNLAVQVCGLVKTFPGSTHRAGCCNTKRIPPYHAVKGLWLNIEKDKLFCLLGPNGAGKTTIINCLTGIVPTTAGDALVYGDSIRSTTGMTRIRKHMGVCPQFDILWDALSGLEHLLLFASIKGLPPVKVYNDSVELLSQVKLSDAATVRSGSYSGGMKRRLSVAIALIGDPKIVYLDEPTTGMDPVTRRHVWDIIENAKRGRAIILTTHSMEEADILGDRIAIMAKGMLQCIGTSIHLKSKFGTGYLVTINLHKAEITSPLKTPDIKLFFRENLGIEPKEENKAYLTFIIPRQREHLLADFFTKLQSRQSELGISDIQLSLTTLEEVFLNIARKAELETAAAEGRFESLVVTSDLTFQVPIGAEYVVVSDSITEENPGGLIVEVYWQQDDTGALCISGYSGPKPPSQPLPESGAVMLKLTSRRSRSQRQ